MKFALAVGCPKKVALITLTKQYLFNIRLSKLGAQIVFDYLC